MSGPSLPVSDTRTTLCGSLLRSRSMVWRTNVIGDTVVVIRCDASQIPSRLSDTRYAVVRVGAQAHQVEGAIVALSWKSQHGRSGQRATLVHSIGDGRVRHKR